MAAAALAGFAGVAIAGRLPLSAWSAPSAALLGVTLGVVASSMAIRRQAVRRVLQAEQLIMQRERQARAEWLHDTVCAELRRARLQLADPSATRDDVDGVLSELEHRIRMGQLDAAMLVGRVRVSEVVQPFLRLLQDSHVAVLDAPCFGDASTEIDARAAGRLRHALSVLVNNAVLAGARGVALHVRVAGNVVEVEVVDDAGGFDLASVPAGRALDSLAHEVGVQNVEARSVDGKTVVRVLMPTGKAA